MLQDVAMGQVMSIDYFKQFTHEEAIAYVVLQTMSTSTTSTATQLYCT
jgi:hypothetical protein